MKKHLKYIDGNSDKFWQIEVSGKEFTVTYGKNGTSGTTNTKTFESDEACLKNADKIVAEKIKKGYSENGEVTIVEKVNPKTGKISNVAAILNEYDALLKYGNAKQLVPFLMQNAKGNIDALKKHIKKNKKYWMTHVDLSLEPNYKKDNKHNYSWGMRGNNAIKEIITLSAIALYDKSDMLSFEEAFGVLNRASEPVIFEILDWAKPNWIEFYLLDRFKKSEWLTFDYKTLRFLEDNQLVSYNPELVALCLSRFNGWSRKEVTPRDYIFYVTNDEIAYQRDVHHLFNYETNIQNSFFRENENANYNECNIWEITFNSLLLENKLDRKVFIENALLIQTKEWNNNLKLFFRKILDNLNLSAEELIPYQEIIFTFLHSSNPSITNYGSTLIKNIYEHPKFKTKSYFEWLEPLMMRSDCKAAIKNNLMILEKLAKLNPKLNKSIALIVADVFIIDDLTLQERATKILLKTANKKDSIFTDKITSYASLMQSSIKTSLSPFLNEEDLAIDEATLENYEYKPVKSKVLLEEVEIPSDWNAILFHIGKFISSDEIIDSEIILNIFIAQRHLFPKDYSEQLQPYLKQLEKSYFENVQKNYIKNLIINKIHNKDAVYQLNDKDYITLATVKVIKPLVQKVLEKNAANSTLPLLSFPSHVPFWVAPKILLERIIAYQNAKEPINLVDLSIAISRMPRENSQEAIPLLEKINGAMKDLLSYCLGVTNEINFTPTSLLSKIFQNIGIAIKEDEYIALWAVAARTYYPKITFSQFEKTYLKEVPMAISPFNPTIEFKEKWNEYRNYHTKEMERSPSWTELTFDLPQKITIPNHFIYGLDLKQKTEKQAWYYHYKLHTEGNANYWHSLMPQNDDALGSILLRTACKLPDGTNNELKGFLNNVNQTEFQFSEITTLLFACCFFQEKKDLRLLASEVLLNVIDQQKLNTDWFATKTAFLLSNKYGVLLRFIEGVVALKDISAKHNDALFLILDGIFGTVELNDKLPANFKKMVENYLDVLSKTNRKPSREAKVFFEKVKENTTLKPLLKQIL